MPKKKIRKPRKRPIDEKGRFLTRYKAEFVPIAKQLAARGMTNREIADILEIPLRSFAYFCTKYPALREALLIAKEVADDRVEASLYQSALGFHYEGEEVKVIEGKVVRVPVKLYQAPSVVAQLAWLNNRRRDEWRKNPEPDLLPPPNGEEAPIEEKPLARDDFRRIAYLLFQAEKGTVQ